MPNIFFLSFLWVTLLVLSTPIPMIVSLLYLKTSWTNGSPATLSVLNKIKDTITIVHSAAQKQVWRETIPGKGIDDRQPKFEICESIFMETLHSFFRSRVRMTDADADADAVATVVPTSRRRRRRRSWTIVTCWHSSVKTKKLFHFTTGTKLMLEKKFQRRCQNFKKGFPRFFFFFFRGLLNFFSNFLKFFLFAEKRTSFFITLGPLIETDSKSVKRKIDHWLKFRLSSLQRKMIPSFNSINSVELNYWAWARKGFGSSSGRNSRPFSKWAWAQLALEWAAL